LPPVEGLRIVLLGRLDIGLNLIRRAFHPENGPLTNMSLPKAEREALCHYLAGAFGYYKNPCSHRDVDMDFLSAFERIVVASDLLKIVERAGDMANKKTQQPAAADALQRPLRPRFQARLSRSVRRQ
jgi:Protein of unknown function (Hypoth_ymh)